MKCYLRKMALTLALLIGAASTACASSIGAFDKVEGGSSIIGGFQFKGNTSDFAIAGYDGSPAYGGLTTGSVDGDGPSFVAFFELPTFDLLLEFTVLDQMLTSTGWIAVAKTTDGTESAVFGDYAIITLTADIPTGDPQDFSGTLSIVQAELNAIPLPAGVALMLAWVGLLGGMRYWRRV